MAGITGGGTLIVDPRTGAGRAVLHPYDRAVPDGDGVSHFAASFRSGALTSAAVVADGPLFSLRWTEPKRKMILTVLEAFYTVPTAFTAAQELGLKLTKLQQYTVSDSNGTAISLADGSGRLRQSMLKSQIADLRIGATTIITAGTRVRQTHPHAMGSGIVNVLNAAAGTQYIAPGGPGGNAPNFGFRFEADMSREEHPIELTVDEGLAVENLVVFPAAGVAQLMVNMKWIETPAYP